MSRSVKKGPFCDQNLLSKIIKQNQSKKKKVIKTRSRRSTILPDFIGHKIAVYNGKDYIISSITEDMVGHKLSEFSSTRNFRGHAKEDKKKPKK
ncbi:MAG: 30S ribosomal protein S19 [Candidatus Phytoplasma cynodontis]|uniref:30S ribosomal protein S19 n=1 Tax='Cynodon dactylon' phytoplasma TaxID=295320 RepID=UPI001265D1C6|nr:30S ribosomal protein S19 ['Cynodon dactylon' phytoplasma]KAB8121983.1 30S ribosomal protein S19 ['Cynodon dactylon' phytoplasma]WIA07603.1 MAG: 30S ribosomal protein S19 [Candidatus Phytoplasma cynodontis]